MIARPISRAKPIPFACPPLAQAPAPATWPAAPAVVATRLEAAEPRGITARPTTARYDGPHALIIRSATSGRQYRFEHPGATQVIDVVDIALMRRIEHITLL